MCWMKDRIMEQMALVWLHVCLQELIPVILSLLVRHVMTFSGRWTSR